MQLMRETIHTKIRYLGYEQRRQNSLFNDNKFGLDVSKLDDS